MPNGLRKGAAGFKGPAKGVAGVSNGLAKEFATLVLL